MQICKKGKIYKIVSENTEKVYIGSTKQSLNKRFRNHKKAFEAYERGTGKYCSAFDILKHGNARIELVCERKNVSRDLLRFCECLTINGEPNAVNKNVPGRTPMQYYHDHEEKAKERMKNYYYQNKDKYENYHLKKIFIKCLNAL